MKVWKVFWGCFKEYMIGFAFIIGVAIVALPSIGGSVLLIAELLDQFRAVPLLVETDSNPVHLGILGISTSAAMYGLGRAGAYLYGYFQGYAN